MAKLTRYVQKLFGSTASSGQISKFGSLAAGSPTTFSGSTVTPDDVQALSNYLQGWGGAVLGNGNPARADQNAVDWLFSRQLAYIFQAGLPEYDSDTTYYIGSFCQVSGIVYRSIVDSNINHTPASSPSQWENYFTASLTSAFIAPTTQRFLSTGTTAGYRFTVTSANATVGATYTNNAHTFTVLSTISGSTTLYCSGASAPLASGTLTKATGTGDATITFSVALALATYTPATGSKYLRVQAVGAGGGGSASSNGTSGGTGSATFFGFDLFAAGAGGGGVASAGGGAGGGGSIGAGVNIVANLNGGYGGGGSNNTTNSIQGASGASSYFGGGGGGGTPGFGGNAGAGSTGSGGGGGGSVVGSGGSSGAGGGAGNYLEGIIPSPSAIYYYAIGVGGTGGTGGATGGAGAAGQITVTEYYS